MLAVIDHPVVQLNAERMERDFLELNTRLDQLQYRPAAWRLFFKKWTKSTRLFETYSGWPVLKDPIFLLLSHFTTNSQQDLLSQVFSVVVSPIFIMGYPNVYMQDSGIQEQVLMAKRRRERDDEDDRPNRRRKLNGKFVFIFSYFGHLCCECMYACFW